MVPNSNRLHSNDNTIFQRLRLELGLRLVELGLRLMLVSLGLVGLWCAFLHFAEAKCILAMAVCVSVCLSFTAFPHYCMDPDVTWRNGRECPLVVHYWVDFQLEHGFS